jgi:hypothetical protein
MNDLREASAVNQNTRGIFWRGANSPALPARSFLWIRVISLWARLQQSFPGRPVRRLRVRETLGLGEKRQLLIVECGERQLLIGAAGNFLTMLAELPAAERQKSETTCE